MLEKLTKTKTKLSPGLRKIIRNVGWLSGETSLRMIINLSVGIYVVRYLGSNDFGKLSYCLSLVGLFTAIAKLGLDNIVVRNLVKNEESTEETLGTAFILKLISSLATVTLLTYCIIPTFSQDSQVHWISKIVALGLVFDSFEVIDFWFRSKVLSGPLVRVRSILFILSSTAKLLFIFLGLSLKAFVWLILVDRMFKAVGTIWLYSQNNKSIFCWKVNLTQAVNMLRDSWPLILSSIMISIYLKIDQVMLGNMASNEVVGNYAAAVRLSEVWYFVPTAICTSVFPTIIRAKQRSKEEYYDRLQQLYDLMTYASLAITIPMTFASNILISTLLGREYTEAGQILALHIWAGPFVFLGVARTQWLMAENLTKLSFATTSLGTITNLLLNFWLIPLYGGKGAAIATVISYAIASYFTCMLYPKMFNTAWMLTKALLIPFRIRQNLIYLNQVKNLFS